MTAQIIIHPQRAEEKFPPFAPGDRCRTLVQPAGIERQQRPCDDIVVARDRAIARPMRGEGHVEPFGGLQPELGAKLDAVLIVEIGQAGRKLLEPAVAIGDATADPESRLLAQRRRKARAELEQVITAIGCVGLSGEAVRRIGGADVDHAGNGIATEQCALRAAQYLDPPDIERALVEQVGPGEIDVVEIDGDRRFDAEIVGRGGYAADVDRRSAQRIALEEQVRDGLQRVGDTDGGSIDDVLRRHDGQRDRHVLRGFLAPPRGHGDDLVGRIRRSARRLCERLRRRERDIGGRCEHDRFFPDPCHP
jgi:hypothetical protein